MQNNTCANYINLKPPQYIMAIYPLSPLFQHIITNFLTHRNDSEDERPPKQKGERPPKPKGDDPDR